MCKNAQGWDRRRSKVGAYLLVGPVGAIRWLKLLHGRLAEPLKAPTKDLHQFAPNNGGAVENSAAARFAGCVGGGVYSSALEKWTAAYDCTNMPCGRG